MKKFINHSYLILIVLFACSGNKPIFKENNLASSTFPQSWQGKWKGKLEIFNNTGKTQSIPMELHILPIDSTKTYTWTIIYGEGEKQQVRAYELLEVNAKEGHYKIDEKNSIVLDNFFFKNTLYSKFTVMGNQLLISVRKVDDKLWFEVISGNKDAVNQTGNDPTKEIPTVLSYQLRGMQHAILSKYD